MNKIIFIFLVITSIFFVNAQSLQLSGVDYAVDSIQNHKVGPGTVFTSIRLTTTNKRLDVFFLKVDATNPYVTFKAALGRDSIYTGEQPSALAKRKSKEGSQYFAGTNGDFYITSGYVGYPVGGCMVDSEIARVPTTDRKIVAFDENKIPGIGTMSYEGNVKAGTSTWNINGVNHLRAENQLVLYNQHNGKITRTNDFGTEVLLQLVDGQSWGVNKTIRTKVIKIVQNKGGMSIPKGFAILSGNGTAAANLNSLAVNDEVEITLNLTLDGQKSSYTQIVGGDNRSPMLKDGIVESNISQVWNELHPRTGIGYSQDKKSIIFCVVDGRGISAGVTTKQLAEIMQSAGAHTAFNMDGGGSSSMYVKDFGQMNIPSDGTERAVANSLFAVSTAPADNVIAEIKSYETTIKLPKYGVFKPRFLGFNQYGFLIDKDLKNVTLICEAALGYINDVGELVASGTSNGKLTASWNGIQTTVNVIIVAEAEIAIRFDSVLIDNFIEYPVEVQSKIGLNTMTLLPSALTWTVSDTDICKVQNGILKGLKNGTTTINGQLGSFKDSLKVIVEVPESGRMVFDDFKNTSAWELTSSLSTWNAQFTNTGLPQHWNHGTSIEYVYKTARSPFIKMTRTQQLYSIPDTVKFVLNTGDANISKMIIGMRACDQTTSIPVTFLNIAGNSDVEVNIPIALFANNVNDLISYPVSMEYITLYLNASSHVNDKVYKINIKEIALRYKNFTTGLLNPTVNTRFSLIPNPVSGAEIRLINTSHQTGDITTTIYTLEGKQIHKHIFGNNMQLMHIPIVLLPQGNYLLTITQGKHSETHKFIKH